MFSHARSTHSPFSLRSLIVSITIALTAICSAQGDPPPPAIPSQANPTDADSSATSEAKDKLEENSSGGKSKEEAEEEKEKSFDEKINDAVSPISGVMGSFMFAGVPMKDSDGEQMKYRDDSKVELPLIVLWLAGAGLAFTLIFKFVNIRLLPLAFRTVRGKYSKSDDPGEITHFQALTAALSGTVGLGNIAGVALAISIGGAGAVFWMVVVGILGMTTKFCECTLGVKYRKIDSDGKVLGGPMYYLRDGLAERNMVGLGKSLAVLFAIVCVFASFGGGNMYQVNQACDQYVNVEQSDEHKAAVIKLTAAEKEQKSLLELSGKIEKTQSELVSTKKLLKDDPAASLLVTKVAALEKDLKTYQEKHDKESPKLAAVATKVDAAKEEKEETKSFIAKNRWVFGLVIALITAVVIIGGIRSIARVTEKLVPLMCGIYIIAAIIVLVYNYTKVGEAFSTIFSDAFSTSAAAGGFIGAFIQGVKRAAFSNEAGFGSAPIAHSAAKTRHPASEGLVALLEPFVDTVIVCTMTGLVIVISGMHTSDVAADGIVLTSNAFETVISWFPLVLSACVILFAFSSMISWSYYGQQAWAYVFGKSKIAEIIYKLIFCGFIVIGSALSLKSVIGFSDVMLFAMSLFNLIGLWILYPVIKGELSLFQKHAKHIDAGGQ